MSAALASMTGYARATGSAPGANFACEIKSVNGRGLDLRLRLAPGFDALESEIRQRVSSSITRGSVTLNLSVERDGAGGALVLNRQALETVLTALGEVSDRTAVSPSSGAEILGIKGVLEPREQALAGQDDSALNAAILVSIGAALAQLAASRTEEGLHISLVLQEQLNTIETLVERARHQPARSRENILAKLRQQVAAIAADITVSEERLAQEALLLATKADIAEELDRLVAHIANARQLIATGGPVGRRLDFLAQEFNREANTLCSKSNAVELTAIGLDLKAVIDQLREQVQNIE